MSDQIDEYMRENFNCSLEAFESKLKKKLSQTQDQESVKRRDAAARHSLMLRAINLIRNNFSRACRIDLGTDCCCIELEVSDRDGWPMLELYLCDSRAPSNQDLALIVWATDRRELGTVTIGLRSGETLGTLHLHDPSEMNRLAHVVQRSIRVFLDCVAERVVKPQY